MVMKYFVGVHGEAEDRAPENAYECVLCWQGCSSKARQAGRLAQQKFIYYGSGGWISESSVCAGLAFQEASILGVHTAPVPRSHGLPLCMSMLSANLILLGHQSAWIRVTLGPHFNLMTSLEVQTPHIVNILRD